MKNKILTLTVLLISVNSLKVIAQNKTIDSLLFTIEKTKPDTLKIDQLINLTSELKKSNPVRSVEICEQALQLSMKLNFKTGISKANIQKGIILINLGKYDESLKCLSQALEISKSMKDNRAIAKAYNNIGLIYGYKGNYTEALNCFLIVLKMEGIINDQQEIADCLNNMGITYEKQGNFDEAMKVLSKSLKISKGINDKEGIAKSLNYIGMVDRRQGRYTEAVKNHLDALKIQEETGDKNEMAYSYQNIGIVYMLQGNYSEGMKNFSAAFKLHQSINNKRGIAESYGNFGWFYGEQGLYDESLKNSIEALKLSLEIGDKQNISLYYNNIGFLYKLQGNYTEAMKNLLAAIEISEEIGDKTNAAETYESIGETFMAMDKNADAILWLNKGLNAASEISSKRVMKECYFAMANVYEKTRDFKKAYQYHKLYSEIEELIDDESGHEIAEMKTNFETEKRDKEIQLLNKDKELLSKSRELQAVEIKKQKLIKNTSIGILLLLVFFSIIFFVQQKRIIREKRLREIATMRSRISQDMHDDVSSGLTKISWMSELLRAKVEKNNFNEITPTLEKIIDSSRETIGKLSEIIWATNPQHDNFESMLSYMRNYISKFFEDTPFHVNINFPDHVEDLKVNPELIRNLFLVMKEALHNAVKYSEAQNINIHFVYQNHKYFFTIADDGKGFDTLSLVEGRGEVGNGLINMKQRIESINGKFELITVHGKGTEIIIEGDVV